jgi:hypothetical protein
MVRKKIPEGGSPILRRHGAPFQFLVDGLLKTICIQLPILAQAAIHGNQRGNDSTAFDEVKGLTGFFVIGGQHIHQMEIHPARIVFLAGSLQLLDLLCIGGNRTAPGGRTTGGSSGASKFVQPGEMENLNGDHAGS